MKLNSEFSIELSKEAVSDLVDIQNYKFSSIYIWSSIILSIRSDLDTSGKFDNTSSFVKSFAMYLSFLVLALDA